MRIFKFLLLLTVLAAVLAALFVWMPYGPSREVFVDITPGSGTVAIAETLQRAGVIRTKYAFEAVRLWKDGTLKAGEYRFDHAAPVTEVYARIRRGDVYTIAVTVPEGYNTYDIAAAVEGAGLGSKEAFLAAVREHTELIAKWSPGAKSLEGFLFPDTYRFSRHATAETMVATMVKRFGQMAAKLGAAQGDAERVVTMASLVEKEVHIPSERPLVAGVFENRLAAGMPLQTDPAVAYGSLLRGTWTGVIHQSELHSDSPYNTYVHTGLPPGPICNPGANALNAALHPAQTQYVYFVADAHGATKFARTLEEHEANVAAYRAAER